MAQPVFFLDDFYREVAKEVDPEADLTPEALTYLQDVAHCFMGNVLRQAGSMASAGSEVRGPVQITDKEISYVLRNYYGMPLTTSAMHQAEPGQYLTDPVPQWTPVEGYQEKLNAVLEYTASNADD